MFAAFAVFNSCHVTLITCRTRSLLFVDTAETNMSDLMFFF